MSTGALHGASRNEEIIRRQSGNSAITYETCEVYCARCGWTQPTFVFPTLQFQIEHGEHANG